MLTSPAMSKINLSEAALRLFNQKGYDAASIRDITKAAGLSTSTFYSHYASKEDLYFGIMEECFCELTKLMERVFAETRNLPADQQLFALIEARVQFFFDGTDRYNFLVRNIVYPPDSLRERIRKRWREWEDSLGSIVDELFAKGQREGVIAGFDHRELSKSVVRMISGFGNQIIITPEGPESSHESLQRAWDIYMLGLKPR